MVKGASSVSKRGLYDWLVQRFSAVYMVGCLMALVVFFIKHPALSYLEWRYLFSCMLIKIVSILFFAALLLHAWVGMWTIYTDYIVCGCLRILFQAVTIFLLAGFFFAALLILWGI